MKNKPYFKLTEGYESIIEQLSKLDTLKKIENNKLLFMKHINNKSELLEKNKQQYKLEYHQKTIKQPWCLIKLFRQFTVFYYIL